MENTKVFGVYGRRVKSRKENKVVSDRKIASLGSELPGYDETLRTALDFLHCPTNFGHVSVWKIVEAL